MLSLPRLWNLVIGYEEETETYTVNHGRCGTFKIRYDAFGHTDPVNWFCVMIFRPQLFDALRAHSRAIERAVESSDGKHKGTQAATYLREIGPHFDANAGSSLGEAADSYDRVVAAVTCVIRVTFGPN